jgi:hypothetical protein
MSATINVANPAPSISLRSSRSERVPSGYLRLLDVPIPVIYGRSADENPFA